jgi:hypothetical protein
MLANAGYFAWKFVEAGSSPDVRERDGASMLEGKPVVLLSEGPEVVRQAERKLDLSAEKSAVEALAPIQNAALPQCFYVGPFVAEDDARKSVSVMKAKGFTARMDSRKVEEKDFWVFIPPFTNREKAEEKLQDLKQRGIEGFVVKEGVFVNSISLNHFSRKELAQAFLQRMQNSGIAVEYREIKRSEVEFWIYLAAAPGGRELRLEIDSHMAGHDGLKRENAACEE